ncbi:hypothetical protein [uncultured Roseobacter sp.]|uniref:hypothetical protein n=1 Tax=uncultured Roseobacter sp. TaxID=114847 RepID=UPI002610D1CA|nr:hypothetical protein [uncultured Roseobacter sp.]
MTRRYFRPLKPKTVIDTLHFIRQEIVRDERDGLENVDALLRMYGAEPMALNMPRKTPKDFRKGELRRMVLEALREGPQTGAKIAKSVNARKPHMDYKQVYRRVYICLWTQKQKGFVMHEGRLWRAAAGN